MKENVFRVPDFVAHVLSLDFVQHVTCDTIETESAFLQPHPNAVSLKRFLHVIQKSHMEEKVFARNVMHSNIEQFYVVA